MRYVLLLMFGGLCAACQPPNTTPENSSTTAPYSPHTTPNQAIKVITPDWGVASTLTAMGYPPLATGDTQTYKQWVDEPKLPDEVIDWGARYSPNPERLAQLQADVIIDNDFYAHLRHLYANTPYVDVSFAPKNATATWQDYAKTTKKLGEIIHQPQKAKQFLNQSKQRLGELGVSFRQNYPVQKIAVVQFANHNSLRIYTNNSLFKPTADEMGLTLITLENAENQGNAWGFLSLSLGDLAKLDDDTCLVVIEPFSPMLRQELANNLLWQRLGYGNNRCMTVLSPIWAYGGVPSMLTFAERLNQADFAGQKAQQ